MAFITSADDIKKSLRGYDPEHSEKMHSESARLADRAYAEALKTRSENAVILLSGGTASGKTEYVSAYLHRRKAIIFDGTLPTYEGAKIKIRKAQKCKKTVEIHAVLPENLLTAFIAFLNRDRKFPPEHFYRTHSESRKVLLEIAKNFTDIQIVIITSLYLHKSGSHRMTFGALRGADRRALIEFLEKNQYTEEEIKREQRLYDI
jgi:hypothetical protein